MSGVLTQQMDPEKEIESLESADDQPETDQSVSVDDFIRELEAKEKDLHITLDTTVIELAESFDDEGSLPDFMKEEFLEEPVKPPPPAIDPETAREKAARTKLEAENKTLKEKVAKLEDERTDLLSASNRRMKDLATYKIRVEKERRETFENQVSNIATQMLPALDNLNRAVDFALAQPREQNGDFQQFIDGVVLVNQEINEVLAEMGIVPIRTVGERFDPHYHEAAATEETDDFAPNSVSAELLKGYRLGDRIIRHSIVRVAKPVPRSKEQAAFERMLNNDGDGATEEIDTDHTPEIEDTDE
jgi:molecular chaperone GrpE